MKKIIGYLKEYFASLDKRIFFLSACLISIAVFINYYLGLEKSIKAMPELQQHLTWYFVFLIPFTFPFLLQRIVCKTVVFKREFIALLLIAPAMFAWKIAANVHFQFSAYADVNAYWNLVAYWPFKFAIMLVALFITWKVFNKEESFYGLTLKGFSVKPYFMMLLIMVPLVAAASTQADFLAMYPKLKNVPELSNNNGWYQLLYELSYGIDFFSIELFFRGFLVLAFAKWVGKDAILPMALFYCTIHFGKPLGECISSFFGGLILGMVAYHTRTIFGGLMVHLGIAWLMELGGYLGNL